MERRVLIAIFLSFLVLYSYQALFTNPEPQPSVSTAAVPDATTPSAAPSPTTAPAEPGAAASTASSATPLTGDTTARDIRIETPRVSAVFTNRGARLKSWRLKDYQDRNRAPVELVTTELANTHPLPFTLKTSDDLLTTTLNSALYAVRGAPDGATVQTSTTTVVFEYRDSAGVSVVKEFQIDPQSYTVVFRADVKQNDTTIVPSIAWGPGLGDLDSQTGTTSVLPGGLYSVTGDVSRLDVSDVNTQPLHEQDFEYVGIDDHYFAALALKPGRAKVTYQHVALPPPSGSAEAARELMAFEILPAQPQAITFYAGPKDFDTLAAIDPNLTKAIHFGYFAVIVVPLLRSLNWIQGYIGNYGWAIFALTVLLNIVLFPLNHKSVVAMRKMQQIQPEAKAIQERYSKLKATDPAKQKMNQELMALYRERGVNPASGCIPILLTLPIFLAFYSMLTVAIELRGAPFIAWIHDLSQPDPYYVMPILVGVSQLITQWMTPQAGVDPAQQKMMMIMPIVLIFVFVTTPSGALIYWFVQNVWRLGQQSLTNYLIGPPNVKAIHPAAERRLKRAGAGKSEGAAEKS